MRALSFDRFGGPEVLAVVDRPVPQPGPDQALVAVRAASVNPSEVKNVAGAMEDTVLPCVPGRDYAGVVVGGPSEWLGTEVWGTGGDIGFTRAGSHAEFVAVPLASLAAKPSALDFDDAAAVGVNFVTAWVGTVEVARLSRGEVIGVIGVSGGVGGAVAQIAKARGAQVVGIGRTPPAAGTPVAGCLDEHLVIDSAPNGLGDQLRTLRPRGLDVVFDAVGGVTTNEALAALAHGGRLLAISATPGHRRVEIDLIDFYHNESRLLGVDTRKLDLTQSAQRLRTMTPSFEDGMFRPSPVSHVFGLDTARDAYAAVVAGVGGRVVIRPDSP